MACSRLLVTLPSKLTLVIILFILAHCTHCQISEVEPLLALRAAISNWDQFAAANNIVGWDASIPSFCLWTGVSCNSQGRVTALSLACDNCNVKAIGTLPPALSTLTQLTSLDLQYNEFTGALPREWANAGQFPALQALYLGNNSLSGEVPWSGTAFPQLQLLRLDGNQLSGSWPESLVLPSIYILRVYNNQLSGSLSPQLLDNMPQMQILSLQSNQLTGELPRGWVNSTEAMASMRELYLQGNQFTGGLPKEWGQPPAFGSLVILNLDDNSGLGGGLPEEWGTNGSFPKLENMWLNVCSLEGELPPSWANSGAFPSIQTIDLSYNNLTGSVNNWENFESLGRLVIQPGNPDLCTSGGNLPFDLCSATDSSCLLENPSLKSCNGETPAAASPDGGSDGGGEDEFPTVAVAVSLGVGIPLVMFLGCVFFLLLRKSRKSREAEAAQKRRRLDEGGHPFDTWEGQEALTSPFAGAAAFSSINAAAVAPVVRTSEETAATSTTPHNSSGGSSSHDSLGSRCARVRTRSFEYPRTGGPPTPPVSGGAPAPARIGVALPNPNTPTPSTQTRSFNPYLPSSLELQPARTSRHSKSSSADLGTAGRGSSSGYTAGSFPRTSIDAASPSNTGSPTADYGLNMPFSDWEVLPQELEIMKRPDGSGADWELGRGAWGRVVKALRDGVQPVAVKELQTGDAGGLQPMSVESFRQEIAILRACRDANIVQFQGAYLGPDKTLLVTEYMEGGDLMANIAAGRVNWWRRGRKIAIDVAKGLCFLHARRIVHFDLKSPNILLGRDGTAKIGDVGMARILARDYVTGVVGTLSWSAPEMLWGAKCTAKADIYSYGIVLWEICTREKPIRGQLRDVRVPEECSEDVRVLMLECLDTRPSRRPSALQIVERLKQSPAAPPPGTSLRRLSGASTGEPVPVRISGGAGNSGDRERVGQPAIAEAAEFLDEAASKSASASTKTSSGGGGAN